MPFIDANKPVLNAEYPEEDSDLRTGNNMPGDIDAAAVSALCSDANALQFSTLVFKVVSANPECF